jgi:hypothetical protein
MAVVLAFLSASFVSRNADFWRHIAAGRLITQFQYPIGGDPFTFTATDRVWVNPNWISEVVLYLFYSIDSTGAVVVGVKAMVYAAAFGLLFWLRKPNFPLWSWAVAATLTAVGVCSQTQLRPYVFGLLMMTVVQLILFQGDWSNERKWRRPLILGGVVALWANLDAFAFLAPLAVALLLIGELIHRNLFPEAESPVNDPFPPVPPVPALGRALLVSLAALLLNPTFLVGLTKDPAEAVAQLVPFEMDFAASELMSGDRDLVRYTHAALHTDYLRNPGFGKNTSGVFAAVVAILGVVLSAVGYRSGRTSHLFLWLGFALCCIFFHFRFIGPFMVVSMPFLAAHLNGLVANLDITRWTSQTARLVVQLSGMGRVATAAGLILLGVCAIPGWLQPLQSEVRALDRWVAWGVEPEEGIKRAAGVLQDWRTDPQKQSILASTRGLITGPEFGDYCAWFAPAEKSFVNSRYRLHRAEMTDLIDLRKHLFHSDIADLTDHVKRLIQGPPIPPTELPLIVKMEKYGASYLCIGQPYLRLSPRAALLARLELQTSEEGTRSDIGSDVLWHLDGRVTTLGRIDSPESKQRAKKMSWEIARTVFGPASALPSGTETDIRPGHQPLQGWEYDFLIRPKVNPVELDDAFMFSDYAEQRSGTVEMMVRQNTTVWQQVIAPGMGLVGGGGAWYMTRISSPPEIKRLDEEFALPILAARRARQAIRETPENGQAYYALAKAHMQELMPEFDPHESRIQVITGLTRALARMPAPVQGERTRYTGQSLEIGWKLVQYHLADETRQDIHIDVARSVLADVIRYASAATADEIRSVPIVYLWQLWFGVLAPPGRPPDNQLFDALLQQGIVEKMDNPNEWMGDPASLSAEEIFQRMKRLDQSMQVVIGKTVDRLESQFRSRPVDEKYQVYIASGLPGRALTLMEDAGDKSKGGGLSLEQYVKLIGVLQRVGRLEEAHSRRLEMDQAFGNLADAQDPRMNNARLWSRSLELIEAKLAGDYRKADALVEEQFRANPFQPLTSTEQQILKPTPVEFALGNGAVTGGFPTIVANNINITVRSRLLDEARFWYNRGLFALLNGDTITAKKYFTNAAKPQGVELTVLGLTQDRSMDRMLFFLLPKYRELLDRYASEGQK